VGFVDKMNDISLDKRLASSKRKIKADNKKLEDKYGKDFFKCSCSCHNYNKYNSICMSCNCDPRLKGLKLNLVYGGMID